MIVISEFILQCDRTVSLNEYFAATSPSEPTILGLLGCGCSAASEPVAEIIHFNSLSQVFYVHQLITNFSYYMHAYIVSIELDFTFYSLNFEEYRM